MKYYLSLIDDIYSFYRTDDINVERWEHDRWVHLGYQYIRQEWHVDVNEQQGYQVMKLQEELHNHHNAVYFQINEILGWNV